MSRCSLLPALLVSVVASDVTTSTTTVNSYLQFTPAVDGMNRGCAGSSPGDIGPGYYDETRGMTSLDACKTYCMWNLECKGIEYMWFHDNSNELRGRCRVWTRDIDSTVALQDFICLRYNNTLPPGTECTDWMRIQGGTGSVEMEDRYLCKTLHRLPEDEDDDKQRRLLHV
eukprot:TRINITY_DN109361_c0_g1_i1.p1 TRINITY_DN109361_c0_g1~~TRINITY_DN109361_c0_g1_i1.p1  ORF type:complete len:171 (+),score=31.80 TRINITY_DN109361_c0_g1_i1:71-583(+)